MPNGDAGGTQLRSWHIYAALIILVLTLGTVVFNAGGESAAVNQRLQQHDSDIKQIRQDLRDQYERKDVVDGRLSAIEESLKRIEDQNTDIQKLYAAGTNRK